MLDYQKLLWIMIVWLFCVVVGCAPSNEVVLKLEPSPTLTSRPTQLPTATPTNTPTATPTNTPTATPTSTPTDTPSPTPTQTPIPQPTTMPQIIEEIISPTGRYIAQTVEYNGQGGGCGGGLRYVWVVDTEADEIKFELRTHSAKQWLSDNLLETTTNGCHRADAFAVNVETGEEQALGQIAYRSWSSDEQRFADYSTGYTEAFAGKFWVYSLETGQHTQYLDYTGYRYHQPPCWVPDEGQLLYNEQPMTPAHDNHVKLGTHKIWKLDADSGEALFMLGDDDYHYFLECGWYNEWVRVMKSPYKEVIAHTDTSGDDWDPVYCAAGSYNNCEEFTWVGLNWVTGEIAPWDEIDPQ